MEDNHELKSLRSTGKSVDEAIFKGLQQMEISIDEVTIEIIQTETKGILGIGAKPAIVQLTQRPPEEYEVPDYLKPREQRRDRNDRNDRKRRDDRKDERPRREERREERRPAAKPAEPAERAERPERPERPVEEKPAPVKAVEEVQPAEPAVEAAEQPAAFEEERHEPRRRRERSRRERENEPADQTAAAEEKPEKVINYTLEAAEGNPAAEFVKGLIERMGAPGQVLAAQDEDCLRLRIDSEMMGVLIGHRGETLDAMQYLTSLVINRNRKTEGYTRVTLDTEDYREKREETLRRLAKKVASQVKATGRAKTLEPMNPYERRVLHSTLQNHPYVTTHSEGDEPNRRVVVTPRRRSRSSYRKPRYNDKRAEVVNGESIAAIEAVSAAEPTNE